MIALFSFTKGECLHAYIVAQKADIQCWDVSGCWLLHVRRRYGPGSRLTNYTGFSRSSSGIVPCHCIDD